MNLADIQSALIESTVYGSVAITLVVILRKPLRFALGAGVLYPAWMLIPMAMVAALLPVVAEPPASMVIPNIAGPAMAVLALPAPATGTAVAWLPAGAWATGVLITAGLFFQRQKAFLRTLGDLVARPDGICVGGTSAGLPAVVGVLRPRIVLPADFAERFDPRQRLLVIEHERVHIARGDQCWNLLVLILRSLFWFNPLVHWAARLFRQDQEMACDARVIASQPLARRQYGEALMRVQLPVSTVPLGCQMGFAHPLAERIAGLKRPVPSVARRMVGLLMVLLMVAAGGFAANAAREVRSAVGDVPARVVFMPTVNDLLPPELWPRGLSGTVRIAVEYDESGLVTSAVVASSDADGAFDEAAIRFARQIRFSPAARNGSPIAGRMMIPVRFEWQAPTK